MLSTNKESIFPVIYSKLENFSKRKYFIYLVFEAYHNHKKRKSIVHFTYKILAVWSNNVASCITRYR